MTSKFKTLLKTTAAVATLIAGSQSWGAATLTGEDGVATYATGRDMRGTVAMTSSGAGAIAGNFTTAPGTHLHFTQGVAATYGGNWTFGRGTKVDLTLTAALIMGNTFTSPSGDSTLIVKTGTNGLTINIDKQDQFKLVANDTVAITLNTAGDLSLPIYVAKDKTLTTATATSMSSKLSGAGTVTATELTKISSDLSDFTGILVVDEANTFSSSLSSFKGTLSVGAALDLSSVAVNLFQTPPQNAKITAAVALKVPGGHMKKVTAGIAGGSLIAAGNLTIEELDVGTVGITLTPNGGVITVKKVTGIGSLTIGAGEGVVLQSLTNYAGVITATSAKLSFK